MTTVGHFRPYAASSDTGCRAPKAVLSVVPIVGTSSTTPDPEWVKQIDGDGPQERSSGHLGSRLPSFDVWAVKSALWMAIIHPAARKNENG
jgi:hypothetical protein